MGFSSRLRFRVPRVGWLAVVMLAVTAGGLLLAIWLPYSLEREAVRTIRNLRARVETAPVRPAFLPELAVFTRVTFVDLSSSAITDDDLVQLCRLSHLSSLHLSKTRVTDVGLAHIARLDSLSLLYLDRTKIGDAGLARL